MTNEQFIEVLRDAGYTPKSYSGRGMYGRTCVSVNVDSLGDAFRLGFDLAAGSPDPDEAYPGMPTSDAMGLGYVLYWPGLEWPG